MKKLILKRAKEELVKWKRIVKNIETFKENQLYLIKNEHGNEWIIHFKSFEDIDDETKIFYQLIAVSSECHVNMFIDTFISTDIDSIDIIRKIKRKDLLLYIDWHTGKFYNRLLQNKPLPKTIYL